MGLDGGGRLGGSSSEGSSGSYALAHLLLASVLPLRPASSPPTTYMPALLLQEHPEFRQGGSLLEACEKVGSRVGGRVGGLEGGREGYCTGRSSKLSIQQILHRIHPLIVACFPSLLAHRRLSRMGWWAWALVPSSLQLQRWPSPHWRGGSPRQLHPISAACLRLPLLLSGRCWRC